MTNCVVFALLVRYAA